MPQVCMYVCMYVCKLRHSEGPQFVAIRTALKSPLGFLEKGVITFALPPSARFSLAW